MINLVLGRQGSGKTLLLVKRAYEYYKKGRTVYSNVHLTFPYKKINYNDVVNCKYTNAIVILDEIHQLLPARRSLSKRNIEICDSFLSMVRKKGLIIYGSTQTERKVDIRFREEADFVYDCEKYAFINGKFFKVPQYKQFSDNVLIIIKLNIIEDYSKQIIETSFIANPLFKLFDTTQIIKIEGLDVDKKTIKK